MSHREWDQQEYRGTVRRRDEYDETWDYSKRRRYDVRLEGWWRREWLLTILVGL
jgi:hypothetical protein